MNIESFQDLLNVRVKQETASLRELIFVLFGLLAAAFLFLWFSRPVETSQPVNQVS